MMSFAESADPLSFVNSEIIRGIHKDFLENSPLEEKLDLGDYLHFLLMEKAASTIPSSFSMGGREKEIQDMIRGLLTELYPKLRFMDWAPPPSTPTVPYTEDKRKILEYNLILHKYVWEYCGLFGSPKSIETNKNLELTRLLVKYNALTSPREFEHISNRSDAAFDYSRKKLGDRINRWHSALNPKEEAEAISDEKYIAAYKHLMIKVDFEIHEYTKLAVLISLLNSGAGIIPNLDLLEKDFMVKKGEGDKEKSMMSYLDIEEINKLYSSIIFHDQEVDYMDNLIEEKVVEDVKGYLVGLFDYNKTKMKEILFTDEGNNHYPVNPYILFEWADVLFDKALSGISEVVDNKIKSITEITLKLKSELKLDALGNGNESGKGLLLIPIKMFFYHSWCNNSTVKPQLVKERNDIFTPKTFNHDYDKAGLSGLELIEITAHRKKDGHYYLFSVSKETKWTFGFWSSTEVKVKLMKSYRWADSSRLRKNDDRFSDEVIFKGGDKKSNDKLIGDIKKYIETAIYSIEKRKINIDVTIQSAESEELKAKSSASADSTKHVHIHISRSEKILFAFFVTKRNENGGGTIQCIGIGKGTGMDGKSKIVAEETAKKVGIYKFLGSTEFELPVEFKYIHTSTLFGKGTTTGHRSDFYCTAVAHWFINCMVSCIPVSKLVIIRDIAFDNEEQLLDYIGTTYHQYNLNTLERAGH
jgi:hypothetical protein